VTAHNATMMENHTMESSNFDGRIFHDNFIHGFGFLAENFESQLNIDIDHIIEWPNFCDQGNDGCKFKVSRGILKFFNVTDFFINLDRGKTNCTRSNFLNSIDKIGKELIFTTLSISEYYGWKMIKNQ
jgi:hypothetical protein